MLAQADREPADVNPDRKPQRTVGSDVGRGKAEGPSPTGAPDHLAADRVVTPEEPGGGTSIGWRSKVHASARSLPLRACVTAVPRMARWPRWMPSKAPSATALGPASGGKDSSPRTICMQDADGPDLAPARHQFADPDH